MSKSSIIARRDFLIATSALFASTKIWADILPTVPQKSLAKLRSVLDGVVVVVEDELYEPSRRVQSHNPRTDKFPAVIVGCASPNDVSHAIRFGQEYDLEIAVQGGGHDVLGQSTVEGGLLIHTGLMSDVHVNRSSNAVTVEAGVRAGQLNDALQEHHLAIPLGCHTNVGVTGLTLGGGLGWLLGKYGVTCDQVSAFEIVTASGEIRCVDDKQDADLFWALRGGGGNFGVVTSIEYTPCQLDTVVRGFVIYTARQLMSFLRFYEDYMRTIPDELMVEVVIANAIEPLISVTFCYSGSSSSPERFFQPLLDFGPPLASSVDRVPYARLADVPAELIRQFFGSPTDTPSEPTESYNYWQGASTSTWSANAIEQLNEAFLKAPDGYSIGVGHYMHGACCDMDASHTPLVRREGSYSYFFNVNWADSVDANDSMNWVDESIDRLSIFSGATYVNYLSSNKTTDVVATYGENYERLVSIKRKYDPENVFSRNRNIRP